MDCSSSVRRVEKILRVNFESGVDRCIWDLPDLSYPGIGPLRFTLKGEKPGPHFSTSTGQGRTKNQWRCSSDTQESVVILTSSASEPPMQSCSVLRNYFCMTKKQVATWIPFLCSTRLNVFIYDASQMFPLFLSQKTEQKLRLNWLCSWSPHLAHSNEQLALVTAEKHSGLYILQKCMFNIWGVTSTVSSMICLGFYFAFQISKTVGVNEN